MNNKFIILCLTLVSSVAIVFALSGKTHEFPENECSVCHTDVEKDPGNILDDVTRSCGKCHLKGEQLQSHPTDIYPSFIIPENMPLTEGRLTCLTCHYVHPAGDRQTFMKNKYFLRSPDRGEVFCRSCHMLDDNKHIVLNKVHAGSYVENNRKTRIDRESLTCIECHDSHMSSPRSIVGAGIWKHSTTKILPHPIGVSYEKSQKRKKAGFKPAGILRKEVKLYEGKIGCGSCHNMYSKEKFMLVMSNNRSALCLECHIK